MNVQPNNRARQCVSSLVPAELRLVLAFFLVAACSTTNGQPDRGAQTIRFAPRSLAKNLSPSEYYPDASRRAHETGEVILHFKIGTDGMAQAPYVVDETTKAVPRLIEEVQKMLRDTHYESGEHYRHAVTAGVWSLCRTVANCSRPWASIITTDCASHHGWLWIWGTRRMRFPYRRMSCRQICYRRIGRRQSPRNTNIARQNGSQATHLLRTHQHPQIESRRRAAKSSAR